MKIGEEYEGFTCCLKVKLKGFALGVEIDSARGEVA